MRALLCAALVALWAHSSLGIFFPSPGSYREASQNYHEIMTNCEQEGGECVDVDFGTTDPPTPPPTPAPTPRPTTPAPTPQPVTYPPFFHWFPFWPVTKPYAPYHVPPYHVPPPAAPVQPPPTPAPKTTTRAPVPPSKPPTGPTGTPPSPTPPKSKKVLRNKSARRIKKQRRNNGEQEKEVRRRRQAGVWDQLYSECSGGWDFDLGCSARGGNVCCYSSSSGSSTK